MINVRYFLRLVVAFVSRFKVLIFLGFGLGIMFFLAFWFLLPLTMGSSVEKVGMAGMYSVENLPPYILNMVSVGLTKLEKDGSVSPAIASSWETPDKGQTWIFHLASGLRWQDGKELTSSDITYSFSDVSITYPDKFTIAFKLQNPYSAFPTVVSKPVFRTGLLGLGKWEVKKLSVVGSYVDSLILESADHKRIIYKFYPTEEETKLAFELGQIDQIQGLFDPKPLNTWPRIKLSKQVNTGEFVAVFLNMSDKTLGDKSLRQALSYAINKELLGDQRAISPISIDSWAYNPQVKPYDYDAVKAKTMIDDYRKSSKVDKISIGLTAAPILLNQAEKIVSDWQAVGIDANLRIVSNVPTDYQALLAIFDIPDDPDQYSIWHSTQTATNITHYSNPRIDKLLEDGRTEIDTQARKQTYFDFQRYLVEDSPAIFLYYPTIYTVSRH